MSDNPTQPGNSVFGAPSGPTGATGPVPDPTQVGGGVTPPEGTDAVHYEVPPQPPLPPDGGGPTGPGGPGGPGGHCAHHTAYGVPTGGGQRDDPGMCGLRTLMWSGRKPCSMPQRMAFGRVVTPIRRYALRM